MSVLYSSQYHSFHCTAQPLNSLEHCVCTTTLITQRTQNICVPFVQCRHSIVQMLCKCFVFTGLATRPPPRLRVSGVGAVLTQPNFCIFKDLFDFYQLWYIGYGLQPPIVHPPPPPPHTHIHFTHTNFFLNNYMSTS